MKTKDLNHLDLEPINFIESPDAFQVDGINYLAVKYNSVYVRSFIGYKSLQIDIDHCLECIQFLNHKQTDNPGIDTWACTVALIITYGKCFASSEHRNAGLHRTHVPNDLLLAHDRLINLRNNYIAHASGDGEYSVAVLGLYPSKTERKPPVIPHPFLGKLSGLNPELRENCRNILLHLAKHVSFKMNKCYRRIIEHISQQDIEIFYSLFQNLQFETNDKQNFIPGKYTFRYTLQPNCLLKVKADRLELSNN